LALPLESPEKEKCKRTPLMEAVLSFFWQNFAKIQPEKYNFDLYKAFSMKKMTQILQISKKKKNSRLPDSYDKFQ
jgi:hypothetical protein